MASVSVPDPNPSDALPAILRGTIGLGALVVFALILVTAAAIVTDDKDAAVDDAYITYIYGKNLSAGFGFRYNPTDEAVTEGASSILHVLLVAAGNKAGVDPLTLSRFLALFAFAGLALIIMDLARRRAEIPLTAAFVSAVIVSFVLLAFDETHNHLTGGLETMLFFTLHGGLVAWAFCFATTPGRPGLWLNLIGLLLAALLILTRPEGFVLAFAIGFAAFIARVFDQRSLGFWTVVRDFAPVGLSVTVFLGIYFLWKIVYFGDIFPTSYWVKSNNRIYGSNGDPFPGLRHVIGLLILRWGPLAAAAIALLWSGAGRKTAITGLLLILPSLLVALLYVRAIHEVTGGLRYGYPLLAPLFVFIGLGLAYHARAHLRVLPMAGLMGLIVVAPLFVSSKSSTLRLLETPTEAVTGWIGHQPHLGGLSHVAHDLEATGLGDAATFLTSAAGIVPYQTGMYTIDWLGLNTDRLSGRFEMQTAEARAFITAQEPDVAISIFPAAANGSTSYTDDPGFNSNSVGSTLRGRGVKLFEHWDRTRVSEMIYSHMVWLRDETNLVACYPLSQNWAIFLYARRSSPHYDTITDALRRSEADECDPARIERMYNIERFEPIKRLQIAEPND